MLNALPGVYLSIEYACFCPCFYWKLECLAYYVSRSVNSAKGVPEWSMIIQNQG